MYKFFSESGSRREGSYESSLVIKLLLFMESDNSAKNGKPEVPDEYSE